MQMATFFGEVLSVYSRAVEEDEEDDHENEEDQQIRSEIEEKRFGWPVCWLYRGCIIGESSAVFVFIW